MEKITKYIADSGVCSRREAERLIKSGLVELDGEKILDPSVRVSDNNIIKIYGKIIAKENYPIRVWAYYKPRGVITTNKDPFGRPTIFEYLKDLPRVISIGRLDINSEGLLLLTNNGMFARNMELPSSKIMRTYKIRAYGDHNKVNLNQKKILIDGVLYHINSIKILSKNKSNSWFIVTLSEGKNRELRKIFEYYGLQVSRLIRIEYGKYKLGDMKIGEYKEIEKITYPNLN